MPKISDLDLQTWNRKHIFDFFKNYENPFFNICANIDVTELLSFGKKNSLSFFQTSLFLSLKTANKIVEFRYRLDGEKVRIHPVISGGSTVLNDDETFSYCYFDYFDSFKEFSNNASTILSLSRSGKLNTQEERSDLIYYSIIPWVSFTSFTHAVSSVKGTSIPKIVFGKYFTEGKVVKMPVSVEVHHALMDGLHVGKFFNQFQNSLDNPGKYLL